MTTGPVMHREPLRSHYGLAFSHCISLLRLAQLLPEAFLRLPQSPSHILSWFLKPLKSSNVVLQNIIFVVFRSKVVVFAAVEWVHMLSIPACAGRSPDAILVLSTLEELELLHAAFHGVLPYLLYFKCLQPLKRSNSSSS